MPTTKLYSIVTNDEYEFPVVCDISGRQAAADYLGIPLTTFARRIRDGMWKGNFKAVEVGEVSDLGEFEPNDMVKPLSVDKRQERYKQNKRDRESINKKKVYEYNKKYYERNKGQVLSHMREYYKANKDKICDYGKEYRKQIKRGERICIARSR